MSFGIQDAAATAASLREGTAGPGFGCQEDAVTNDALAALRIEAIAQRDRADSVTNDGEICYRARLAPLGQAAKSFLAHPAMLGLLEAVLERDAVLSADASCYTYYQSGDFLGAHRDNSADCEVTVILYLDAYSPAPGAPESGLSLRIFGARRDENGAPLAVIPTRVGTLVVGRGAQVWHERPILQKGEYVVALTACYCLAGRS